MRSVLRAKPVHRVIGEIDNPWLRSSCITNNSPLPIKIPPSLVKTTMLRASRWLGNDVAKLNNWGFLLRQKWGVLLQQRYLARSKFKKRGSNNEVAILQR